MYVHLLVPIDSTELSIGNVESAVELAHTLAAKVTFCHVLPDYAAMRAAARSHRTEGGKPLAFSRDADTQAQSRANSFMAKAGAYAEARGVTYATLNVSSERPADAIVRAAGEHGCDLIVMASHAVTGLRTLFRSSLTARVLREADVPVLITRVQATDPHAEASRACALIQDEHRSLAAIVQGMARLVASARSQNAGGFDREGFELMLRYVHDFPQRLHHPKEEQSLHRRLRARGDRANALLDSLEAQHRHEYELVSALQTAFTSCAADARDDDAALAALSAALDGFAAHVWDHLRTEEHTLLPMAVDILDEKDWAEIAQVFEGNQDPGYGGWSDEEFRRHFMRLATRMALPWDEDSRPAD